MNYVDLEIGIYHPHGSSHIIEMRRTLPNKDSDVRVRCDAPQIANDETLLEHRLDKDRYGAALTAMLFQDQEISNSFLEARTMARDDNIPLRLRIVIGPNAQDLHYYYWETLLDPDDSTPLGTNDRILLSRYPSTRSEEPIGPRPKSELRSLVAIANPSDLEEKSGGKLAPLDVDEEAKRAGEALQGIDPTILDSGGKATLDNIIDHLREGFDILYLVCHGQIVGEQTWLYLENADGGTHRVPGSELVTRFREMRIRPRLIVFASCESAGSDSGPLSGDEGALAPIGITLASEAGIGAVVAVQGNVLVNTWAIFVTAFFAELQKDGMVDRAMAVARGKIRKEPDWWAPILFMRLKSGRIWYPQGFTSLEDGEEAPWPNILDNIRDNHCTPILGPGLTDRILGTRRQIARRWAARFRYPMSEPTAEDLPQVAQYLAVKRKQLAAPQQELRKHLEEELRQRYASRLPKSSLDVDLPQLISNVCRMFREEDEHEPHRLLAQFPLSVYITTNVSNALADAIAETPGRKQPLKIPHVEWCKWNKNIDYISRDPDGKLSTESIAHTPDPDNPLIYHLFGHLDQPNSIVLTEDDYFDYLIGSTSNKDLIPNEVRAALTNAGLLFLGYQLDDWNFRVLFRSIIKQEGASLREQYAQTAVQIDPEESRILEPEGARNYLEKYFQRAGNMNVYWGSSRQFIVELHKRLYE